MHITLCHHFLVRPYWDDVRLYKITVNVGCLNHQPGLHVFFKEQHYLGYGGAVDITHMDMLFEQPIGL